MEGEKSQDFYLDSLFSSVLNPSYKHFDSCFPEILPAMKAEAGNLDENLLGLCAGWGRSAHPAHPLVPPRVGWGSRGKSCLMPLADKKEEQNSNTATTLESF